MINLLKFLFGIVSFLLISFNLSCARSGNNPPPHGVPFADTPDNGVYVIENVPVQLENGLAEMEAAPGSASKIRIVLQGEAVYGDLNYDTERDAVIFLNYQGGGSGTFFYLAAALHKKGGFSGKNSIWIGDRIGAPAATVSNGLITVKYLDRRDNEPMAAVPSQEQTRYFMMNESKLQEIIISENAAVFQGWLTIGHEVRSFLPCNESESLWLTGKSTVLDAVISAYTKSMTGSSPYIPVFAIIAGSKTASPSEGFGSDYKKSLSVNRLVHLWPQGNCRSDFVLLDSPRPGAIISSPLRIKGQARGTWFFEGDFPVILMNSHGEKIAESYASAKDEWMTENFVFFEGIINFDRFLPGQRGTLALKKDNPTGLTQFDDKLEIPIYFK